MIKLKLLAIIILLNNVSFIQTSEFKGSEDPEEKKQKTKLPEEEEHKPLDYFYPDKSPNTEMLFYMQTRLLKAAKEYKLPPDQKVNMKNLDDILNKPKEISDEQRKSIILLDSILCLIDFDDTFIDTHETK